MKKSDNMPLYTCGGLKGILVKTPSVESKSGYVFVPDFMIEQISDEEEPCLSYDDLCAGTYCGENELVETRVVNQENEYRLIFAWVTKEYAESDRYQRELLVDTGEYHDWVSERTRFKRDRIPSCLDDDNKIIGDKIDLLKEEWAGIVARYSDPIGGCEYPLFDELVCEFL